MSAKIFSAFGSREIDFFQVLFEAKCLRHIPFTVFASLGVFISDLNSLKRFAQNITLDAYDFLQHIFNVIQLFCQEP
jgi:hypothetical protein